MVLLDLLHVQRAGFFKFLKLGINKELSQLNINLENTRLQVVPFVTISSPEVANQTSLNKCIEDVLVVSESSQALPTPSVLPSHTPSLPLLTSKMIAVAEGVGNTSPLAITQGCEGVGTYVTATPSHPRVSVMATTPEGYFPITKPRVTPSMIAKGNTEGVGNTLRSYPYPELKANYLWRRCKATYASPSPSVIASRIPSLPLLTPKMIAVAEGVGNTSPLAITQGCEGVGTYVTAPSLVIPLSSPEATKIYVPSYLHPSGGDVQNIVMKGEYTYSLRVNVLTPKGYVQVNTLFDAHIFPSKGQSETKNKSLYNLTPPLMSKPKAISLHPSPKATGVLSVSNSTSAVPKGMTHMKPATLSPGNKYFAIGDAPINSLKTLFGKQKKIQRSLFHQVQSIIRLDPRGDRNISKELLAKTDIRNKRRFTQPRTVSLRSKVLPPTLAKISLYALRAYTDTQGCEGVAFGDHVPLRGMCKQGQRRGTASQVNSNKFIHTNNLSHVFNIRENDCSHTTSETKKDHNYIASHTCYTPHPLVGSSPSAMIHVPSPKALATPHPKGVVSATKGYVTPSYTSSPTMMSPSAMSRTPSGYVMPSLYAEGVPAFAHTPSPSQTPEDVKVTATAKKMEQRDSNQSSSLGLNSYFRLIAPKYTPREAILYQKSWNCKLVIKVLLTMHEKKTKNYLPVTPDQAENSINQKFKALNYFRPNKVKLAQFTVSLAYQNKLKQSQYLSLNDSSSLALIEDKVVDYQIRSSDNMRPPEIGITQPKDIHSVPRSSSPLPSRTPSGYVTATPSHPRVIAKGDVMASPKVTIRTEGRRQSNGVRNYELFLVLGELPLMTKRGHFIIHGSPRVILSQLIRTPGIYFTHKNNELQADCIPEQGPWLCVYKNLNDASYYCYTKQFSSMPFSLIFSTFRVFELHSQFTDQTLLLIKLKTLEKLRQLKEIITTLLTFTWKKRIRKRLQKLYTKKCFISTQQFEKTKILFRLKKKLVLGTLSRKSFNEKLGLSSCINTGITQNIFSNDSFNPINSGQKRMEMLNMAPLCLTEGLSIKLFSPLSNLPSTLPITQRVAPYTFGVSRGNANYGSDFDPLRVHTPSLQTRTPSLPLLTSKMIAVAEGVGNTSPLAITQGCEGVGTYVLPSPKVTATLTHTCPIAEGDGATKGYVIAKSNTEGVGTYEHMTHAQVESMGDRDTQVSKWLNSTNLLSQDLALIVRYLNGYKIFPLDDIDDLNNQRVRTASDQIQQQVRIGIFRLKKMFLKLISSGGTSQTITDFLNGTLREFFGGNPLSQFLDQTNPLAEITHKRRISKLGIGGIQRESATLKVRTIHSTYFGRICPIETPEGLNAGLVNSLTCLSRIDEKGQLVTPLSILIKGQKQEQFFYYSNKENNALSTTDTPLLKFQRLPNQFINTKNKSQFQQLQANRIKLRVTSDLQTISLATALIPFLAYDDANRALMGSNMQRQAVPLILPERPMIRTGMESLVINESGHGFQSSSGGFISYVSAQHVIIICTILNKRSLI